MEPGVNIKWQEGILTTMYENIAEGKTQRAVPRSRALTGWPRGARKRRRSSPEPWEGPRGQPLTEGVEEALPGHQERASPASGRDIQAGGQAAAGTLGQAVYLGQCTGGSRGARGAAPRPGQGKAEPSACGAGGLSGPRSQALVIGGSRGPGLQAQGRVSGGNGSAGLCPNLSLALGGRRPPCRLR